MVDENNTEEPKKARRLGFSFTRQMQKLGNGGFTAFLLIAVAAVLMGFACLAVFFAAVHGEEKALVPNVVGKPLTTAQLELQAKELYPKLILRYSDLPGDYGTVLDQDPAAGSIVKAYRRITLTVSRGEAMDNMEDFIGKDIDSVQQRLELLFAGSSLVQVSPPVYQKSDKPIGTVLAQYPEASMPLDQQTKIQLVVSSGQKEQMVKVPSLEGLSVQQVLDVVRNTNLVFDFTSHDASSSEKAGTVAFMRDVPQGEIKAFSHVSAEFAFPLRNADDRTVYGILTYTLPSYPFPVPVTLEVSDPDGNIATIASLNHPGGEITIPYVVRKDSILTLYALDREVAELSVN